MESSLGRALCTTGFMPSLARNPCKASHHPSISYCGVRQWKHEGQKHLLCGFYVNSISLPAFSITSKYDSTSGKPIQERATREECVASFEAESANRSVAKLILQLNGGQNCIKLLLSFLPSPQRDHRTASITHFTSEAFLFVFHDFYDQ